MDGLVHGGPALLVPVGLDQVDLAGTTVGGTEPERSGPHAVLERDLGAHADPEVVGQGELVAGRQVPAGVGAPPGGLVPRLHAQPAA